MDLEQFALLLVPVATYLLTYLFNLAFKSLPKVAIPIIAGILGPVSAWLLNWVVTIDVPTYAAVFLGGLAVWFAEFVGQIRKQVEASDEGDGIRWKTVR